MVRSTYPILSELQRLQGSPFVLAHRGTRARAPENSMAAFQLALSDGADALETDLRITRDRVIVCIHDDTVDRTTNGTGAVAQLTWSELQQLRLRGNNDTQYPDERVPSFDEFLAAFAGRTSLALELKTPCFTELADVDLLLKTLQDQDALDRVIALSFSREILHNLEQADAPFPLGLIEALRPWPSRGYPLIGHWWPLLVLNPLIVAICRRRGQVFCPLDPAPEPRLRAYLWLGVDGVLSDDPRVTRLALEQALK